MGGSTGRRTEHAVHIRDPLRPIEDAGARVDDDGGMDIAPDRQVHGGVASVIVSALAETFGEPATLGVAAEILTSVTADHLVKEIHVRGDAFAHALVRGGDEDQRTSGGFLLFEPLDQSRVVGQGSDIKFRVRRQLALEMRAAPGPPQEEGEEPEGIAFHQPEHGLPHGVGSNEGAVEIHAQGQRAWEGRRVGRGHVVFQGRGQPTKWRCPLTSRASLESSATDHTPHRMKQIPVGVCELRSSCLAYGCWRIAGAVGPDGPSAEAVASGLQSVIAAYESGYTLFDNADIYGGGAAEKILGQALKGVSGMRERIVLLTKCGVRHAGQPEPGSPHRYDLSADYIIRCCEESLKRLGVETIDIYMLHRADYLVDPAEVARAFAQLKEQGKVRHFGVSNFRPTLLATLQAACPMPIVTHQFEFSLSRLDPLGDGTLDQCLREGVTPMAWSPLGGGLLADGAGRLLSWQQRYDPGPINPVLDEIAAAQGVSRTVVALGWLMRHPARVIPIVGSTKPDRIRQAAKAADIELSREEWYRLFVAAQGKPLD